jgi:hypothetical protein
MTAEELQTAIEQFGLTMERAAERLGIGVRSLYRYVSGERAIPRPIALAIRQQQELRRIRTLVARGADLIW